MPRELHPENLRSLADLTTDEVRKIASKGGKKSAKVRKERKLMSQIYADILSNSHNLAGTGTSLDEVIQRLLACGNVQMIKEIREATEGSKVINEGAIDNNITISFK